MVPPPLRSSPSHAFSRLLTPSHTFSTLLAGLYYKHLPAASLVCGPKLETASWAMRHMTQMRMENDEGTLTVRAVRGARSMAAHLLIDGYEPEEGGAATNDSRPSLGVGTRENRE